MAVIKEPCGYCNSTDNKTTFDNGSQWCFTTDCEFNKQRKHIVDEIPKNMIEGQFAPLANRRISQRTCEVFGYQQGMYNNQPCHIANIYDTNTKKLKAQQLRLPDKQFVMLGNTQDIGLVGLHLWGNKGRSIVITEGYIDMLSIAEMQDCKWPVCTVPNGAQSAVKAIKKDLATLLNYESIVLCFDNDEAGKKAVEDCVGLFPPGRVKIAALSEKDANDVLVKGKGKELTNIVFTASEYRPDGIIWGTEIDWKELRKPKPRGLSLPYPALDEAIRGLKDGRIYTIYAGTGNGKSTSMREIALHITKNHKFVRIANIFLEENLGFTAESYIAMHWNVPQYKLDENPNLITNEQHKEGEELINDMAFYKHFGSLDSKHLFNLLDYLVIGRGIKLIMLDHISLLVSGLESSGEGERKDIDKLVTNLRSFCERTQAIIVCATQLKRKEKSYSKGQEINDSDARGCVDNQTEYLTQTGWKTIDNYTNEKIGIYSTGGELRFDYPFRYIKTKADKFFHLKSTRGIDQVVSPEHKMIYQHGSSGRNIKLQECKAEEFVYRHGLSITGSRRRFRTTFKSPNWFGTNNSNILRLQVAYQADGTFVKRRPLCHVFKFIKERKYIRLKELLINSGLKFKDYGKFKCGQYCIETKIPDVFKEFPKEWYCINENDARIIIDEARYWDSELTTGRYCSTSKVNADFIQYCFAICNIRSIIGKRTSKIATQKDLYNVNPSKNNTVSLANKDKKPEIKIYTKHNGLKYCFTTYSGMWIARRNGRIFITGNSGAIEHISDVVFSLNVNDDESPYDAQIKILKNRITGFKGNVDLITYNPKTGRYLPKKLENLNNQDNSEML